MTAPRPSLTLAAILGELRAQHTPSPRCALPWCPRAPWRDGLCQLCACHAAGVVPVQRAK